MKNTQKDTNLPKATKKKSAANKTTAPEPVAAESPKALGVELPLWVRNSENVMLFGLKVDQVIFGNEIRVLGWLVGTLDKLELRVDGKGVLATFSRNSRPDVTHALGINDPALNLGFELQAQSSSIVAATAKHTLYWAVGTESGEIDLSHGNELESKLSSQAASSDVKFHLDEVVGPSLHGWLMIEGHPAQNFSVSVDDRVIGCDALRVIRKDVAAALGVDAIDLGFQVTIPGYIWEDIPHDKNCPIQLLADGVPSLKGILTRKGIVDWVESLVELPDNSKRQYLALLALEHLRFGDMFKQLTPSGLRFMQDFIKLMKLTTLPLVSDAKLKKAAPVESLTHLLHRKAMWTLNNRLSTVNTPTAIFATVVDVMHELDLDGEIKIRYIDSVIPTLCRHNVFTSVRELTDFSHWHTFAETAETCWGMSVSLPALVVDRKIPTAVGVLWKLSKHLHQGWINTECIHYSVKEFIRQFLAGQIDADQVDKFTYAVMAVFDGFQGKWFSRLHDRELVQAAAALIPIFYSYSDLLRRDYIKSLIRNFGLIPEFWQIIDTHYADFDDVELNRARMLWLRLYEVLDNRQAIYDQLDQLLPSLRYFQVMGNLETVIFIREIAMNSIIHLNGNPTPTVQMLIGMLLKDVPESLRLGTFPLNISAEMQSVFPECSSLLLQTLRSLSPNPGSTFYQAQAEAGRIVLQTVQASLDNDRQVLSEGLKKLRHHAAILNNWPSQYLSVDLLLFVYELGRTAGLARDIDLHKITENICKIMTEMKPGWLLPAPVQAALFRLHQYKDDVVIRAFLGDIQNRIQEKFEDTYDFLFEAPPAQVLSPSTVGFPTDTLVVIYSCRKYLNSRIPAIRNTWVQDLNARNIPYLVLVGDGDDTISGDVLALNVSDKYEDLPRKTLKLFDWVLNNTSFHYVYKIDDDCYLDVSRFFDSLTYRKHVYYGRVIKRPIGGMDRTWHQSKSHTFHAQKVLDKSPEPSVYADGGGGYILSRYAMMQLQKNIQTEAGQRLLAVSLMEDKLVGDLLTLSEITPSNEDYESYQRRRTFAEAVPVGMFDNLFYPSPITPTVMAHLDSEHDLQGVYERHSLAEIWPKKVWPTGLPLLLKAKKSPEGVTGSNQLELLNSPEHLSRLLDNPLAVVVVVRNEMIMLPHFLNHYRQQGVRCFLMVDNLSDDGTREYLLEQPDVGLFSADTEYKNSHYGVAWQQALLGNFCLNKWVLLADADELLVYPDCETVSLPEFIAGIEQLEGADCIRTDMIDMYPFDNLEDADLTVHSPFEVANWFDATPFAEWELGNGFFSNAPGLLSNLRHRITPLSEVNAFTAQKYGLLRYKPWMRLSQGIHDAAGVKVASQGAWFAHFKYHAAFKDKVETEILRGQHFDNAKEYIRYAEILAESKGGFGKEDESVCYQSSADLSALVRNKK